MDICKARWRKKEIVENCKELRERRRRANKGKIFGRINFSSLSFFDLEHLILRDFVFLNFIFFVGQNERSSQHKKREKMRNKEEEKENTFYSFIFCSEVSLETRHMYTPKK